ncbi:MAG TPA: hypothetical protein VGX23_23480 [Actinocrinis sp.]|nr:hypothetical protein [Actinocrinis sp.]
MSATFQSVRPIAAELDRTPFIIDHEMRRNAHLTPAPTVYTPPESAPTLASCARSHRLSPDDWQPWE